jgi:hypothetical protein
MQNIKLEIPAEPEYIQAASDFFNTLRGLKTTGAVVAPAEDKPVADGPSETLEAKGDDETNIPGVTKITKETEAGDPPPPPPGAELSEDDKASLFTAGDDGIERDAAGFPWDKRIHSGNGKKYPSGKDAGKWMRRRGVTPEVTAEVEAELLFHADQSARLTEASQESEAGDPPPPPPEATAEAGDPPPPGGGAIEARTVSNFPEFMALVSTLKSAGKITDDQLNEQATLIAGVPNVALMATKLDFIPALGAAIQNVAGA